MEKFWKWVRNRAPDIEGPEERTLYLDGAIGEDTWLDDDVTPALFKSDLESGEGDITVWINSPGGDCFAAAEIYNMLLSYKGKVTVKIDGLAASAASVIAMAGDKVIVSPVSMIMIHNPATVAMGDHNDMTKAIEMLDEVKNSIINAYATKTGLSRNKLSKLMEDETWMDAGKAVELHFADEILKRPGADDDPEGPEEGPESDDTCKEDADDDRKSKDLNRGYIFSEKSMASAFNRKLQEHCKRETPVDTPIDTPVGTAPEDSPLEKTTNSRKAEDCMKRLELIGSFIHGGK